MTPFISVQFGMGLPILRCDSMAEYLALNQAIGIRFPAPQPMEYIIIDKEGKLVSGPWKYEADAWIHLKAKIKEIPDLTLKPVEDNWTSFTL